MAVLQGSAKSVAQDGGFYPKEIAQSLRFNDNDSAYLSRTPSVAGNRKTWTWSGWVKRGNLTAAEQRIFSAWGGTSFYSLHCIFNSNESIVFYSWEQSTTALMFEIKTTAVFRDPSSWYHVVLSVDTTQATASDRIKIYVNGVKLTSFSTASYPTLNKDTLVNISGQPMTIGAVAHSPSTFFDGYLAEVHFTDGTAYTADDFGEFKSGVWVAKTPSVTYGTNGFYLNFSNSGSIGADSSGNSNNWTAANLAPTDVMLDSPTNNFATLNSAYANPYNVSVNTTLAEGNTKSTVATGSVVTIERAATLGMTSGKWYWECKIDAISSPNGSGHTGIRSSTGTSYLLSNNGVVYTNWTVPTYSGNSSYTTGDIIGVAYDADNGDLYFYKNGVVGNGGTPILTGLTGEWYPIAATLRDTTASGAATYNFGQDSSFAGTKTPQGNTDANGIGDFYYAPPTGYLALCTANLPEPAISPLNSVEPSQYFNTVLWSGNSSTQSITGVGFQPDLIWEKSRTQVANHRLIDSVRGVGNVLSSSMTNAEFTEANDISSIDADGFTTGSNADYNLSGNSYVAWIWKAGGTPVTNTNGTITSSVSANTESGFSIVSFTGNGSSAQSIGHGLSQQCDMIIVKGRANLATYNQWFVWHKDLPDNYMLYLNTTDAQVNGAGNYFVESNMTSTTFGVGNDVYGPNVNGTTYISYCFHSVEGFSKFGTYTGNGNADGPFVYTGFRPAFVMVKKTDSTDNWIIIDNIRDPDNAAGQCLYPNLSNAENGPFNAKDFLSNGFKCRSVEANLSGGTYIYMAFAENPFKYSNAR
jgi:hypothetical protein